MSIILGKYFDEFTEGEEIQTLGRTVTEADIVNFSGFSGDFNPLHTDAAFAATQPFGGRIAHGMCGMSIAIGLLVRLNFLEGTIMAFFGVENWRFKWPIMIGDTIHVNAKIAQKKETRKPDRGLIFIDCDVVNQNGQSTMCGRLVILMKRTPKS
ncbi:MAG: MaoC/PaaZ C-terminal domain-containing protein [Deltaproteobacteria bacterium]|nr:MaoC/PaaZ C-terminal domain-containing protein [Deltaproteobacteria bacterium]